MKNDNGNDFGVLKRLTGMFSIASVQERNMLFFACEGILIALVNNLINSNNYLFATRLGSNDFQLSLVTALPQFASMLVLIPGGILADRLSNKRRMVMTLLLLLSAAYVLIGFVPMLGANRLVAFLILLPVSAIPLTLYNSTWQAYFSDVVQMEYRNRTYTLRTRWGVMVSIAASLITGTLLSRVALNEGKLALHQSFFWISAALLLLQTFILSRISGGNVQSRSGLGLKDLVSAAAGLIHNRKFIGFVGVALFFYMTWQMDWTIYFLAQIQYLKLNEAWLSYIGVSNAVAQFLMMGFWSRINERYGVRFSIIFGSLGLVFWAIAMYTALGLPHAVAPILFLVMCVIANLGFAAVPLNIYQCMLQVVPEHNKTLSISIYTVLIALSNAVMPVVGVRIYTILGADLQALRSTFLIVFLLRIVAVSLWIIRYRRHRNDG